MIAIDKTDDHVQYTYFRQGSFLGDMVGLKFSLARLLMLLHTHCKAVLVFVKYYFCMGKILTNLLVIIWQALAPRTLEDLYSYNVRGWNSVPQILQPLTSERHIA